jgi:capsular polysaccharide biosynthesis protein/Mrp family chromosome partitioning ATPase
MGNPRIGLASFSRRWWGVIALAVAGGALAAYVYGSRATPTYEADAQVLVEADAEGSTTQAAQLSPTYAEMVTSTPVLAFALRSTGASRSVDDLRENVRGESDDRTRLIEIRVDDTDSNQAVALANAVAAGLRSYVADMRTPATADGDVISQPQVRVVEPASSAVRVRPLSLLLLGFGAVAGLFGGLAFALVVESRSPNVTDEDDLVWLGRLPVLGSVNGRRPDAGRSPFDPAQSSSERAAPYRRLATNISIASPEELTSLVVVGADGSEASCAVAVHLALASAQEGRCVVLADFEGDRIRGFLRIDELAAGAQLVKRAEPLTHSGTVVERFTFRSGTPLVVALPRVAPRGLSQEDAATLVARLSAGAELLIIHAPPPSYSRSTLTWARASNATILVVRAEETKRANVRGALEGLQPVGTKLIGTVLKTERD